MMGFGVWSMKVRPTPRKGTARAWSGSGSTSSRLESLTSPQIQWGLWLVEHEGGPFLRALSVCAI